MSTINIPQNGLPQEIAGIPYGQVIVLTDPNQGITSTTTQQILAIISIAGKLGQSHIVYALPVQYSGLWGCYICKVKTAEGDLLLVSDKDSLLEMLCEFWGLDYIEVSKSIKLSKRYDGYVSIGGESHPVRIPVVPAKKPKVGAASDDYSVTLQCIRTYTKDGQLAMIEDVLEESINHGLDISILELGAILERVKERERKTYLLEIYAHKGKEDWDPTRTILVPRYDCDFCLIDLAGNPHSFKVDAQSTAMYLTFILFSKEGKKLADLKTDDDFYNTYKFFCQRLKHINKIPDKKTLGKYVNDKRKVIKKAIKDTTNDDKIAQEMFCIEGVPGELFRVEGATDDNRATIREQFEMD